MANQISEMEIECVKLRNENEKERNMVKSLQKEIVSQKRLLVEKDLELNNLEETVNREKIELFKQELSQQLEAEKDLYNDCQMSFKIVQISFILMIHFSLDK